MNGETLKKVYSTLSLIEVKGRSNLTLLYNAFCFLENESKDDILNAYRCLNAISVSGKRNIDMLLACEMTLERYLKEQEENVSGREEGILDGDGDTGAS